MFGRDVASHGEASERGHGLGRRGERLAGTREARVGRVRGGLLHAGHDEVARERARRRLTRQRLRPLRKRQRSRRCAPEGISGAGRRRGEELESPRPVREGRGDLPGVSALDGVRRADGAVQGSAAEPRKQTRQAIPQGGVHAVARHSLPHRGDERRKRVVPPPERAPISDDRALRRQGAQGQTARVRRKKSLQARVVGAQRRERVKRHRQVTREVVPVLGGEAEVRFEQQVKDGSLRGPGGCGGRDGGGMRRGAWVDGGSSGHGSLLGWLSRGSLQVKVNLMSSRAAEKCLPPKSPAKPAVVPSSLPIGELARRSGVAASALRFYEAEGLLRSHRNPAGRRLFARHDLRRVAFIRTAQTVGLSLDQIRTALTTLPEGRAPTPADWKRLSRTWRPVLDARIADLTRLRDQLDACIGCGCLSLGKCALYNPGDIAARHGPGPRFWLGNVSTG
jgi:MerR family transcriptional regulator, redox-sensitive transcriptional activator SoxR